MRLTQFHKWATFGTCDGLCVKTPVEGILIFRAAFVTEWEIRHGCIRAVVRNAVDDRVARSAIGAVNEWMQIAPVARIKQLAFAIDADGDIRSNGLICIGDQCGGPDLEIRILAI